MAMLCFIFEKTFMENDESVYYYYSLLTYTPTFQIMFIINSQILMFDS